jgi:hypothetical protein
MITIEILFTSIIMFMFSFTFTLLFWETKSPMASVKHELNKNEVTPTWEGGFFCVVAWHDVYVSYNYLCIVAIKHPIQN